MLGINEVHHGDCLELMQHIPSESIDLILCDLPYGTSACAWDSIIPLEALWKSYKRIIQKNGSIVLTSSQPFTTALIHSNLLMFKYSMVWCKNRYGGFFDVKYRPLKAHEDISVFSYGGVATGSINPAKYNPQGCIEITPKIRRNKGVSSNVRTPVVGTGVQTKSNYPTSLCVFPNEFNTKHPTQKPVALFEYLIRTYTNEGDLVLDNCGGAGTAGVAAVNSNRNFILIEKELKYVEVSKERIAKAVNATTTNT